MSLKHYFTSYVYARPGNPTLARNRNQLTFSGGSALVDGKRMECMLSLQRSKNAELAMAASSGGNYSEEGAPEEDSSGEFQRWQYRKDDTRLSTWRSFLKDAPVSNKLGNKCIFRCSSCETEWKTATAFKRHTKIKANACSSKTPRQHLSKYVTKKIAFVCIICKDRLLCDINVVYQHMMATHGLNCSEYRGLLNGRSVKGFKHERHKRTTHPRGLGVRELNDFLKDGPFSQELKNECVFQCPNCKDKFGSWESILRHHTKRYANCKGIQGYKNIQELTVKRVTHACKICGSYLLCDRSKIAVHLSNRHKILLKDYNEFAANNSQQTFTDVLKLLKDKEDNKLAEWELSLQSVSIIPSDLFSGKVCLPHQIPKENTTFKVDNLCQFACPKCSLKHWSWTRMEYHMKNCLGNGKFENCLVAEARAHMCYICSKRVLCDVKVIMNHVNSSHHMKLHTYKTHLPSTNNPDDLECFGVEKEEQVRVERRSSVPVVTEPFKTATVRPSRLSRKYTTALVDNLCLYRCTECPFESETFDPLRTHLLKGCAPRGTFSSRYLKEARYHRCGLCSTRILCDRYFIAIHANSHYHSMTIGEYERRLKEQGGGESAASVEADKEAEKLVALKEQIKPTKPFPTTK